MKTYYDSFVLCKSNRNSYIIPHTVMESRYTNVKYYCEISWHFTVHGLPQSLRNYKEEAKIKPSEKALTMPGQIPLTSTVAATISYLPSAKWSTFVRPSLIPGLWSFLKTVRIYQHKIFQATPSMHCPENAPKPPLFRTVGRWPNKPRFTSTLICGSSIEASVTHVYFNTICI